MDYEKLKKDIEDQNLTLNGLAKKIGVSRTGLMQTIDRQTLQVKVLISIAHAIHQDPRSYFRPEDIPEEAPELQAINDYRQKYLNVLEENRELYKKKTN